MKIVKLYFTEDEMDKLRDAATYRDKSVKEYCRYIICQEIE